MRALFCSPLAIAACAIAAAAQAADPFAVTAALTRAGSAWQVSVAVEVPPRHVVYADRFSVSVNGQPVSGTVAPAPVSEPDPTTGGMAKVYASRVVGIYAVPDAVAARPVDVAVQLQGCSETVCFLPRTARFTLNAGGTVAANPRSPDTGHGSDDWLGGVTIASRASGYLPPRDFLDFLLRVHGASSRTETGLRGFVRDPAAFLTHRGLPLTVLLVLVGGLLLNLTPCVLPMIPINLAVIGAGARAGSRARGLALGAAYGGGIAVVYGALGLAVVLTGSVFGALQSSPLFNAAAAVIFLVLGLALFDVVPIDLSRFQRGGTPARGFVAAAVAGGVSALLAGACVAPVVAAVLLLAGTLYHGGSPLALLLPFMLGVGMALPWPLAGAGLAVLPKPGSWMTWVKAGFGALILIMGLYYGWLAWRGFRAPPPAFGGDVLVAGDRDGWQKRVDAARAAGKPLMLDFYASWCKDCHVMDRTTLRDPAVRKALQDYVVVRVETERPDEQPAAAMVQAFGVSGLPCHVVVKPTTIP